MSTEGEPDVRNLTGDDWSVWPACSECGMAYVHRRALSLIEGWVWIWQQDCKHGRKGTKQPEPILMTAAGPYEGAER